MHRAYEIKPVSNMITSITSIFCKLDYFTTKRISLFWLVCVCTYIVRLKNITDRKD